MFYYIFWGLVAVIIIWSIGSYYVVWSIEKPVYTVLEKRDGYEIREYSPYIVAQTTVTGNYDEATNSGFRIIADYIFGNNLRQEGISMTSPVLEGPTPPTNEEIDMTSPVLETVGENQSRIISFVLPSKYTLETLPKPNNEAVKLVEVPARKVAALEFTWYPTAGRVEDKKATLLSYLVRDGAVIAGETETARYNPPLSMPLLLRNEILIPIN
jgi:hypothetical protein